MTQVVSLQIHTGKYTTLRPDQIIDITLRDTCTVLYCKTTDSNEYCINKNILSSHPTEPACTVHREITHILWMAEFVDIPKINLISKPICYAIDPPWPLYFCVLAAKT